MSRWKTLRCICASVSALLLATTAVAQDEAPRTKGIQYEVAIDSLLLTQRPIHFFEGFSLSVDLAGIVLEQLTSYGHYEAALRFNLKEKYFPIVEVGLGKSNHRNEDTELRYRVSSPYFRIGCDYNFARDLRSGNRILAGLRMAYTDFQYDVIGPEWTDPYWGTTRRFDYRDLKSNYLWAEVVFGLEANVWRNIHLGWTARYKRRLNHTLSAIGSPWYVPGFGKSDSHLFSGTFNILLDL